MTCRMRAGSTSRSSTVRQPMPRLSSDHPDPAKWNIGIMARLTEVWSSRHWSRAEKAAKKPCWVIIAPLGRPVVPDVKIRKATSSGAGTTFGSVSGWSASQATEAVHRSWSPRTTIVETVSRSGSMASRWDTNSGPTTMTLAWASLMMWRISAGVSRQLTPTLMALSLAIPNATSKYSGPFLSTKATVSWAPTPADRRALATRLERRSSSPKLIDRPSYSRAVRPARSVLSVRMMSAIESSFIDRDRMGPYDFCKPLKFVWLHTILPG